MSKEDMIEEIKKMTVVELADLVKAIEEEFGVSAVATAAPAAGAAATATGAAAETPNSSSRIFFFSVVALVEWNNEPECFGTPWLGVYKPRCRFLIPKASR